MQLDLRMNIREESCIRYATLHLRIVTQNIVAFLAQLKQLNYTFDQSVPLTTGADVPFLYYHENFSFFCEIMRI